MCNPLIVSSPNNYDSWNRRFPPAPPADRLAIMQRISPILLAAALVAVALPSPAAAQLSFEVVGARALGMGGAFVGVADDATAVHWNPAGLATSDPIGMTFGWDRFQFGNPEASVAAGPRRDTTRFTSFGSWPLGISYGRVASTRLTDDAVGITRTESLVVNQVGVTILQTLVERVVVGATFKYLRGKATTGLAEGVTAEEALDRGGELDGDYRNAFDLDLGFMMDFDVARLGLTVKNLRQPTFRGEEGFEIALERRVRMGLAVLPSDGLTLAMDIDLDTADQSVGLRRMIALGAEQRLGSRVAVRGGVRWSRDGSRRPIGSVGSSVTIRPGLWLDGYYTQGRNDEGRGFGLALRAGY